MEPENLRPENDDKPFASLAPSDLPDEQTVSEVIREKRFHQMLLDPLLVVVGLVSQLFFIWMFGLRMPPIVFWAFLIALIVAGSIIMARHAYDLPINHPDFPEGYSVSTPLRSVCSVALFLALWALTVVIAYLAGVEVLHQDIFPIIPRPHN
ncbi:hypothetical protein GC197_07140 [bacterium]|nr:hypothetical protein [bacterium]